LYYAAVIPSEENAKVNINNKIIYRLKK